MNLTNIFYACLRSSGCFNRTSSTAKYADTCQSGMTLYDAKTSHRLVAAILSSYGFSLQQSYMKNVSTGIGTPHIMYVARYTNADNVLLNALIVEDTFSKLTTITLSADTVSTALSVE